MSGLSSICSVMGAVIFVNWWCHHFVVTWSQTDPRLMEDRRSHIFIVYFSLKILHFLTMHNLLIILYYVRSKGCTWRTWNCSTNKARSSWWIWRQRASWIPWITWSSWQSWVYRWAIWFLSLETEVAVDALMCRRLCIAVCVRSCVCEYVCLCVCHFAISMSKFTGYNFLRKLIFKPLLAVSFDAYVDFNRTFDTYRHPMFL